MRLTGIMLLFSLAAVSSLVAWSAPSEPFRLDELRWKNRVLIAFSPEESHLSYRRQLQEWQRSEDAMRERQIVFIPLVAGEPAEVLGRTISPDLQRDLRRRFGASAAGFTVILLGLDGGVKLRRTTPVEAIELIRLVDSMPMRQQEMRQRKRDNRGGSGPD
jgi:hypothetical protein